MKKLFMLFSLLVLNSKIMAQADGTNYNRTNIYRNLANCIEFGTAKNATINQSTGSPTLSIPIFTVEGNELSVPISLNYSFNGFRPGVPIGWAGLGWSIEAGGVITRTVHGAVDHTFITGRNYDDTAIDTALYSVNPLSQSFLESTYDVLFDTEPDVYNFNFPGYSGKFICYKGGFVCMPEEKMKITGDGSGAFTITTANGTRYTFAATEATSSKGSPNAQYSIPTHVSAWYLTEIENAAGNDRIVFTYTDEGKVASQGVLAQSYKKNVTLLHLNEYELLPAREVQPTYSTSQRLTSITSPKHSVAFNAQATKREDLRQSSANVKAIRSIGITDHMGQRQLKKFTFNMEYFNPSALDTNAKYLKLKSLDEVPSLPIVDDPDPDTSSAKKTWTFDYKSEDGDFPSQTMAYVDHYGFYTGKGDFSANIIPNTIYAYGPDRDPVLSGSSYGALSKVTYPTGGYSTYEYEQNVVRDGETYIGIASSKTTTAIGPALTPSSPPIESAYRLFHIGNTQNVVAHIERDPVITAFDGIIKHGKPDFKIYHATEEGLTLLNGAIEDYIGLDSENGGRDFTISLSPGYYSFMVQADDNENYINGTLNYDSLTTVPREGRLVGGTRIKTIKDFPLIGNVTETSYRYTDSLGFSTGISNYGDTYLGRLFREIQVPSLGPPVDMDFIIYNSAISMREDAGVPHYYTGVYEDRKLGSTSLTTMTRYVNFSDVALGILPSQVIAYKNVADQKIPVSKTENYYDVVYGYYVNSIRAYQDMQMVGGGFSYGGPNRSFNFETAFYMPAWLKNTGSRHITYNGADSLVSASTNVYDISSHNLRSSEQNTSDGATVISRFKYPEDYTPTLNSTFISANVLNTVWEKQTWRKKSGDSLLVGLDVASFDNNSFLPVRIYQHTAIGTTVLDNETMSSGKYSGLLSDSGLEERTAFTYDSASRTISQLPKDGIPVSYKWGYSSNPGLFIENLGQKNYPIAEAVNALPTEFYFQNFEEASAAVSGDAHTGQKYLSGDCPVGWPVPNGREYVLTYWYLDSGRWQFHEQAYTGSTTLTLGSAIDDVLIFPKDARVSTFSYLIGVGLSSRSDPKGLATYFEYDSFNRLKAIRDQHGNLVKGYMYNYQQ